MDKDTELKKGPTVIPPLNDAQRRRVSITLGYLEKSLVEIERALEQGDYRGILFDLRNDVPQAVREELLAAAAVVREHITVLAERFDLQRMENGLSKQVASSLVYCWETLVDSSSKGLKGYGVVSEGLGDELDPELDAIIAQIWRMRECIFGQAGAYSGGGNHDRA